ncbi:MAG: hypothetical protein GY795_46785 [Desulfobacterales bacterium]|nr:hypothetical protein [Desulfobacterales bacterium]
MLYEIRHVKQNREESKRRWFTGDFFDLLVWLDEKDSITGFQLCYDKSGDQRALTWHEKSGYSHNRVDEGESKPGKPKSIPVLVLDGLFANKEIADIFKKMSKNIDKSVSDFVYKKILQY